MMLRAVLIGLLSVATILTGGCASQQAREFRAWIPTAEKRAEAGDVKWSDVYREAYDKINRAPDAGKADAMEHYNTLLNFAIAYEGGRLSKDEFDNIRRIMKIDATRKREQADTASRMAIGSAMQRVGNIYKQRAESYQRAYEQSQQATPQPIFENKAPAQIQCQTMGSNTYCTGN